MYMYIVIDIFLELELCRGRKKSVHLFGFTICKHRSYIYFLLILRSREVVSLLISVSIIVYTDFKRVYFDIHILMNVRTYIRIIFSLLLSENDRVSFSMRSQAYGKQNS